MILQTHSNRSTTTAESNMFWKKCVPSINNTSFIFRRFFSWLTIVFSVAAHGGTENEALIFTQLGETPGGGCIGETRIYLAIPSRATLKNEALNPFHKFRSNIAWKEASGNLIPYDSYRLTTIGCGFDRIAAAINGKTYLLESTRIENLGKPVTYINESDLQSPRIIITHLENLHSISFPETECVQNFQRVRILVEIAGLRKTFTGTAIGSCP